MLIQSTDLSSPPGIVRSWEYRSCRIEFLRRQEDTRIDQRQDRKYRSQIQIRSYILRSLRLRFRILGYMRNSLVLCIRACRDTDRFRNRSKTRNSPEDSNRRLKTKNSLF